MPPRQPLRRRLLARASAPALLAAALASAPAAAEKASVAEWDTVLPQHENRDYLGVRPTVRYSHTATAIGDDVIFAFGYFYDHEEGGADGKGGGATWTHEVWALNGAPSAKGPPPDKRWTLLWDGKKASQEESPLARMNHVAVANPAGDGLLIFGGTDTEHTKMNDVWEFNVASKSWTLHKPAAGPVPEARNCHAGALLTDPKTGNPSLVVYGGFHLGDTWALDLAPTGVTWRLLQDRPAVDHEGHPGVRSAHAAVTGPSGDKMYVYGGFRFDDDVSDQRFGVGKLEDMWAFSLGDNKWERIEQVSGTQGGRQFFSMALVPFRENHGLATFAGVQCKPNCNLVGSVQVFSLADSRWYDVDVKEEPLGRYHDAMAFVQGGLWSLGGESYDPYMYHNAAINLPWPPPPDAVRESPPMEAADGAAEEL